MGIMQGETIKEPFHFWCWYLLEMYTYSKERIRTHK